MSKPWPSFVVPHSGFIRFGSVHHLESNPWRLGEVMDLTGRVALVTGASQGIGKACALLLAEAGVSVALGSRNLEKLQGVAKEIEGHRGKALALGLDVSSPESVKAAVAKVLERWGKVDILVNNAGITRDNLVLRMKLADWEAVMRTNLDGAYHRSEEHTSELQSPCN